MLTSPLGLHLDPLTGSVLAGIIWPLIQAVIDKVEWTAQRRRVIAIVGAVVISIGVWLAGEYPASWDLLVTQAGVALGCAQTAFTIMKRLGVLDWVGVNTPGGEPKHLAKD